MADEKKKKGRRSYLSDFTRDLSGTYIYVGDHYSYIGNDFKRKLALLWLCLTGAAICTVSGGCIPSEAMKNSFYVIAPYIAEIGATGFGMWYMFRLSIEKKPIRAYVYESTVKRLPKLTIIEMFFLALGVVGYVVYFFMNGITTWNIIGLLLKILTVVFLFFFYGLIKKQKWEKIEKKPVSFK